jgi:hypothetical protein
MLFKKDWHHPSKFQVDVNGLKIYSILFTTHILKKFGQNIDGFEILASHLFCRNLTKKENGSPW